jgi:hypothetical protein
MMFAQQQGILDARRQFTYTSPDFNPEVATCSAVLVAHGVESIPAVSSFGYCGINPTAGTSAPADRRASWNVEPQCQFPQLTMVLPHYRLSE